MAAPFVPTHRLISHEVMAFQWTAEALAGKPNTIPDWVSEKFAQGTLLLEKNPSNNLIPSVSFPVLSEDLLGLEKRTLNVGDYAVQYANGVFVIMTDKEFQTHYESIS